MIHQAITPNENVRRLFTGDNLASRGFQLAVTVVAVALLARTYLVPPSVVFATPFGGPAAGLAAVLAVLMVGLGGLYPLPLGDKDLLSLSSTAAFATLLVFPPREALPLALGGTLFAQIVRWRRRDRLTPATILFNLAQYLVTWSLAGDVYYRIGAGRLHGYWSLSWAAIAAAGAVYFVVNTWVVTTWTGLRRRAWTWDVWTRAVREAAPGYIASLGLGAAAACLANTEPLVIFALIPSLVVLYQALSRMSGVIRRQSSAPLEAMVEIIEQRSLYMAEHSERVAWWAQRLARHLGLPEEEVEAIGLAAKLHDLGRAILPEPLEAKPGPLVPEERVLVQQHPGIGADVVARLPGFETVSRYVRHHHERYDGQGYPKGLRGEEIPLGARVIAVADAFDAMVSDRAYRPALPLAEALAQISSNLGKQFDPRVASALLALVQAERRRATSTGPQPKPVLAAWPHELQWLNDPTLRPAQHGL